MNSVKPDFLRGDFYDRDSFLVCSDGFRHQLTEVEIYEYCHTTLEGMEWLVANRMDNSHFMNGRIRCLIDNIKERGEQDNISAILIKAANTLE